MKAGFIKPGLFNSHVTCRRSGDGPVNIWEVAITVYNSEYDDQSKINQPVILFAGKELGFGLAYCDSDKEKREHFVGSFPVPLGQDYAWQNADVFAALKLVE